MQFNVVVEGAVDGKIPDEESLAELRRYLRSSTTPEQLLQRLQTGKPFVIKKGLEYQSAIQISDKLFDYGLETYVDPPVAPEAEEQAHAQEEMVTMAKVANGDEVVIATNSKSVHAVSATNAADIRALNVNNSRQRSNTAQATHNKVHAGQSISRVATRPAAQPSQNQHSRSANVQNGPQSNVVKLNSRPKANNANRITPKQASKNSTASSAPSNNLKKSAADVKQLFRINKATKLELQTSNRERWQSNALALCSILLSSAYFALALLVTAGTLGLFVIGVSALSQVIPTVVAILFMALVTLLILPLVTIVILPLFMASQSNSTNAVTLQSKDEPKLFMLVSALSQLLKTPMPSSITVAMDPRVTSSIGCSIKELLQFNKALTPRISLCIGAPLLRSLSVESVVAGVTPEIARYFNPKTHRPGIIFHSNKNWFERRARSPYLITSLLSKLQLRGLSDKAQFRMTQLITVVKKIESLPAAYFQFCTHLLEKLQKRSGTDCEAVIDTLVGSTIHEDYQREATQLVHVFKNCTDKIIHKNSKSLYVDNLADLVDPLFKDASKASNASQPSQAVIQHKGPMYSWLDNAPRHCRAATLQYYRYCGIEIDQAALLSTVELAKKKQQDSNLKKISTEYFYRWLKPDYFWKLPEETFLKNLENKELALGRLNQSIKNIRYFTPDRTNTINELGNLLKQIVELRTAKKAQKIGAGFTLQNFSDLPKDLDKEIHSRTERLKSLTEELRRYHTAMGDRLAFGLILSPQKAQNYDIIQCLKFFEAIEGKYKSLLMASEELASLTQLKPKKGNTHYSLYLKELSQEVEEMFKSILKRARLCPFKFCDKQHNTLADLLNSNINKALSENQMLRLIEKSKLLQQEIGKAFIDINKLAAGIASKAEEFYKAEKIKVVYN